MCTEKEPIVLAHLIFSLFCMFFVGQSAQVANVWFFPIWLCNTSILLERWKQSVSWSNFLNQKCEVVGHWAAHVTITCPGLAKVVMHVLTWAKMMKPWRSWEGEIRKRTSRFQKGCYFTKFPPLNFHSYRNLRDFPSYILVSPLCFYVYVPHVRYSYGILFSRDAANFACVYYYP